MDNLSTYPPWDPSSNTLSRTPKKHTAFRLSTDSTVTTLPEYTTSPPTRQLKRPFLQFRDGWKSSTSMDEAEMPPGYKSPTLRNGLDERYPDGPASEYSDRESFSGFYDLGDRRREPQRRTPRHQHQPSVSTELSNEDEEFDARLDGLIERSVQALELSNQLLSQSMDTQTSLSPFLSPERSRSAELRGRRRDRMPMGYRDGRRRWANEPVMEVDEEDEEDESNWDEGTYSGSLPGSLPEQTYMSPRLGEFRPPIQRVPSLQSSDLRSTSPSLDPFVFPNERHQHSHSDPLLYSRTNPAPPSPASSRHSSNLRAPRPQPLNLLAGPQLTATAYNPSTPAYKLVSSIVSREASQQRVAVPSSRTNFYSQPPTPTSSTPSLLHPPRASPSSGTKHKRNGSAEPPKGRRLGGLPISVSVPDDIGKWMRGIEPVQPTSPPTLSPPPPIPVVDVPQQPVVPPARVIERDLPPSPPLAPAALSYRKPDVSTDPSDNTPLKRSISQLRAILSSHPAQSTNNTPSPVVRRRHEFRPATPQVPSVALTRPPPTRSHSDPAPPADEPPPNEVSVTRSKTISSSLARGGLSRVKGKGKGKRVSFSPVSESIPNTPPRPPTPTPIPSKSSSGWSLVDWLIPGVRSAHKEEASSSERIMKASKESPKPVYPSTWLKDGRPEWSDRVMEPWQM